MAASGPDRADRAERQRLLQSARELLVRARVAKQNSRRLITDAERLIPPVLCRCGAPLYSASDSSARVCPTCAAGDPDH